MSYERTYVQYVHIRLQDDLVLNRRRFIFLTNLSLLKREEDKRLNKIALASEKVVDRHTTKWRFR